MASESEKSSCMRSWIEAYICHRGKFPFPGLEGLGEEEMAVAFRNGLEAERRRRKRIARWHEGLYKVGDKSWRFEGRLLTCHCSTLCPALIIVLRCRSVTTLPSFFSFLGSKPRVFRVLVLCSSYLNFQRGVPSF